MVRGGGESCEIDDGLVPGSIWRVVCVVRGEEVREAGVSGG
jgi:hypothetical protein